MSGADRRRALRRGLKWSLWVIVPLLATAAAVAGFLWNPGVLFPWKAAYPGFRVYSDAPLPPDIEVVLQDVRRRMAAMEGDSPQTEYKVYLCSKPERYALLARLTRRSSDSLAICLTAPGNIFVSLPRVSLFAERNRGVIRHSRFEGNLAEVIAHEIAHFRSGELLGLRAHLRLPAWKSEGWAEYQANLAAVRADGGYDLARRIDLLFDDSYWRENETARGLYEWQMLVEYLGEVEGLRLEQLADARLRVHEARERMLRWRGAAGQSG